MNAEEPASRFLYWLDEQHFEWARERLQQEGYRLSSTPLTPCQVLNSRGKNLIYAPPQVWSRICVRQGTWYHKLVKQGLYMLMSDHRLQDAFDEFLDAQMTASDFMPETVLLGPTRLDVLLFALGLAPVLRHFAFFDPPVLLATVALDRGAHNGGVDEDDERCRGTGGALDPEFVENVGKG